MMRTLLFLLFACCGLSAQITSDQYPISKVKVYKQGAQIERVLNADLQVGINTITFEGLSRFLDPNSIQINGLKSISLISISHSSLTKDQLDVHPTLAKLRKEIAELKLQQRYLNDDKEGLLLERKYLESNTSIGGTEGYNITQLREVSKFVRLERSANAKALSKLDFDVSQLQKAIQTLERTLSTESSALSKRSNIVSVKFSSPTSQKTKLSLSYQVSQAGWSSNYDLKVASLAKPVNLSHKAIIYQNTGENWLGVKLVLNTGSMSANGQIPAFSPDYLFPLPINNRGARADAMSAPRAYRSESSFSLEEKDKKLSASNLNTLSTNLLSRSYFIAEPVSIETGKTETNLLRELDIPAVYEYQSIPKLDPSAFLIARIYDWSDYDLEAGEIALYNAENYVGKSYLNPNVSEDTLELSLGKDADIIVEREKLKDESGTSFFGSTKSAKFVYEIKVFNKKSASIRLVLIDQVPVARHEDIKVKVEIGNLKLSKFDQGKITWKLMVPAKGQATKKLQYEISYPKEMKLNR
jgi:uncharacterized protein (TIGR02231 family)